VPWPEKEIVGREETMGKIGSFAIKGGKKRVTKAPQENPSNKGCMRGPNKGEEGGNR